MKTPRRHLFTIIGLATAYLLLAPALQAAGSTESVQVILVDASNAEGGVDGALRPYAGPLQRLFRFKSYQQLARRSFKLEVPGEGSVELPGGQRLVLKAGERKGPGFVAELTWSRGNTRLLHTRIQLRPGNPAVLGGPASGRDGGNYLLILEIQ